MSNLDPLAKTLGAGVVDLQRRLDAAERKAETLHHALNGSSVHLEACLDVMASAVRLLTDGPGYDPATALSMLKETVEDITGEVVP